MPFMVVVLLVSLMANAPPGSGSGESSAAEHPYQLSLRGIAETPAGRRDVTLNVHVGPLDSTALELVVPESERAGFDFGPFEGPDAPAGALTRLLVTEGRAAARVSTAVAGWYSGDVPGAFVLEVYRDRRDAQPILRLLTSLASDGAHLRWSQLGHGRNAGSITATFTPTAAERRQLALALARFEHRPLDEARVRKWRLETGGYGPVRLGMTLPEASQALGVDLNPGSLDEDEASCFYGRDARELKPTGIRIMFVKGRVARFDVWQGPVRTTMGAGVGTTEGELRRLYPSSKVEQHPYTDGHYVVVVEGTEGFVFETDGERVLQFRGGTADAVRYIEGCH
jgi:hypothetical protein